MAVQNEVKIQKMIKYCPVKKKWRLDFRLKPNTKRIVRFYKTKSQANEALIKFKTTQTPVPEKNTLLTLDDLINLWYASHGLSLKSSLDTKARLLKLSKALGNPPASSITALDLTNYRTIRLSSGIQPGTLNRELNTFKALYRESNRLGFIDYVPNFLELRKIKQQKTELNYLTISQVKTLIEQAQLSTNCSLYFVVMICLTTGCRWSEAEGLKIQDCINGGFNFTDTKNGHSRFVPVESSTFKLISDRLNIAPFERCYSAYRSAFERCNFPVTKGQLAHIMRHTYASHFMMNGGNILALQKILGHSSLNLTMIYSHLSPDYLASSVSLNPVSLVSKLLD